jgi:lia operon protein LiaG
MRGGNVKTSTGLRTAATVLLTLSAAAALADAAAAQGTDRFTLTGDRVAVHNVAGEVRVERGTGSAVVVEVTRRGADADRLRVTQGSVGGSQAVRIAYPTGRIVYPAIGGRSSSTVSVDRDGLYGTGRTGIGLRRVNVTGSGRGSEAWADVRILVPAGRTLAVHQAIGRVEIADVEGDLLVNGGSVRVNTAGTRGSLDVDTGSGSVSVTNADGDLRVDTGSGSVQVSGVSGGRVVLDTGSGSVRGSDVRAGELVIDTGSGSVAVDGVAARRAVVDTGSGSVRLGLASRVDDLLIDTGSGSVALTVPPDFGADVRISTGSGGINVGVPATVRRSVRSRYEGTVGDGRGRVVIDTGSGGVRIQAR